MISALLSAATPPSDDKSIATAIQLLKRHERGSAFLVGLRNDLGDVYRRIVCSKSDDVLALAATLKPFGFAVEGRTLAMDEKTCVHVFSR